MTLQPRSLCMAIADKLRQRILAHEWPPGAPVNDADIARGYGVSRTPVREAFKLLCQEGLLQSQARRGMVVAAPDTAQLREALALQQWLQGFVQQQRTPLPADSLARTMLRMAENRLQLSRLVRWEAPAHALADSRHGSEPASHLHAVFPHSPSRVA